MVATCQTRVQRACVPEISRDLEFLEKRFKIISREATCPLNVTAQFSSIVLPVSSNVLQERLFSSNSLPPPPFPAHEYISNFIRVSQWSENCVSMAKVQYLDEIFLSLK